MDRPTRRYISIADAAEYLKVSDRTVRRMIADGELTGYRMGRGRTLRVDLNEIDENLMRPIGGTVWRDTAPRARARGQPGAQWTPPPPMPKPPSAAAKTSPPEPEPLALDHEFKRWCKCGHTADAHGLRTTIAPGTPNPPKIGVCWTCGECDQFVETLIVAARGAGDH
jgi:excisionase family DNA binding protein